MNFQNPYFWSGLLLNSPLICLAHEPGLVKLQVAMNGIVISNTVIFEFKSKANNSDAYKRLEIDDLLLTTNLEDAATEAELQQPDVDKQR